MKPLHCCAVGFALLIAHVSLHCTAARSDELPTDTNAIENLTPEQARKLAEKVSGGPLLFLSGLTELDAATAKALADLQVDLLRLDGLTTLDAATAKAIGEFKVKSLTLDGLTTLDTATATALAAFKGHRLVLSGLAAVDAEAAKALAEFKGKSLWLDGLTTINADTAKALAESTAWDGRLLGITALDSPDAVAIAQALVTRKGPLKLTNLKKISPRTLSALIEKKDVEIPLIETLELIQEPDGSATDDFVIPEGFQQAQQSQRK